MMSSNTPSCWETAHQLYKAGKEEEAIRVCEQEPCASGSVQCQRFLGWNYYEKDDLDKALFWFSRAIARGDTQSKTVYGMAIVHFAKQDFVDAAKYFKAALACGNYRSYHWLGLLYENGMGVNKDVNAALDYYRKGAEHGYMRAQGALNRLAFKSASPSYKIVLIAKRILNKAKVFLMALRNIKDERLADIPEKPLRKSA